MEPRVGYALTMLTPAPPNAIPVWRRDIDALVFPVEPHSGTCAVHRRAFRTLLHYDPEPEDCLRYFTEAEPAFKAAAQAKIAKKNIRAGMNFHLTSRDIERKLLHKHPPSRRSP